MNEKSINAILGFALFMIAIINAYLEYYGVVMICCTLIIICRLNDLPKEINK